MSYIKPTGTEIISTRIVINADEYDTAYPKDINAWYNGQYSFVEFTEDKWGRVRLDCWHGATYDDSRFATAQDAVDYFENFGQEVGMQVIECTPAD